MFRTAKPNNLIVDLICVSNLSVLSSATCFLLTYTKTALLIVTKILQTYGVTYLIQMS